jgi:hypothetical protein
MSGYITVAVSQELLDLMLTDWSPPCRVKMIECPGSGTGWTMIAEPVDNPVENVSPANESAELSNDR